MFEKKRPTPEELLKRVQAEEEKHKRGKLKIYLGAAPGVGKTYAMLQDALVNRAEGLDVVAGIVESHGRKEIDIIIEKFEVLPRLKVDYRGKELFDFDLDAAIKRQPALLLIDEMAHTNAPGLRHERRWQDIREILDRGINVYTTLNVQHVESLNDTVSKVIGIPIKETVPDSMLELADTIEIIDLSPDDLLKRLHEGKVYFPQQAELAREHYFQKSKLTALRELALRVTAERVRAQVLLYRQDQDTKLIWRTKEKIAVCVGYGNEAIKLMRVAKHIAESLQANWVAVHVDSPRFRLTEIQRNNLIQNLHLAERLGAEIKVLTGLDISKEILNYSRNENITQIIIWKPYRSRFRDLISRGLVDELVRHSAEIDIHIVTPSEVDEIVGVKQKKRLHSKSPIPWLIYGVSIGVVAVATFINIRLFPYLQSSSLIMIYFLAVIGVALFEKTGPSILASVLSVLAYKFFFVPPKYSLIGDNIEYYITLFIMLIVNQVIINLSIRTRRQAKISYHIEQTNAALQVLNRQLVKTRGVKNLLDVALHYIGNAFNSGVMAFLPDNSHIKLITSYNSEKILDDKERAVAQWVYDMGQVAGLGTDTLSFSDAIYIPLIVSHGTIGVLRIHPHQSKRLFSPNQMHVLEACAHQIALALDVDLNEEQAKMMELQSETDHARLTLLKSVSRELRKPLSSAMSSASVLMEENNPLNSDEAHKVARSIYFELDQLSSFIDNFLQITYLEAEEVKLQKQYQPLNEVIQLVLSAFSKQLGKKPIQLQLPESLPKVPLDRVLLQVVFANLIDNAIKFTSYELPIEISAALSKSNILVRVEDRGPGIESDEINKLFDKFYCGSAASDKRGLGLGLAVCARIIKAHGGEIWAENRKGGGAAFCFTLPLKI